jgi:glucose-1-phosphate thymidylyltransferase
VAEVGSDGWVRRLVEKPQDTSNNLVVVGCYYFRSSEALLDAIEEQIRRNTQLKGEFFLTDAVNIMLERGLRMRTQTVGAWLDAGTPEAMLDTNRYLLDNGLGNAGVLPAQKGVTIIPPVYIHPSATLRQSVVGPHVSIGANCIIENAVVQDSILEDGAQVRGLVLGQSLVGRNAQIEGRPHSLNVGDQSQITV